MDLKRLLFIFYEVSIRFIFTILYLALTILSYEKAPSCINRMAIGVFVILALRIDRSLTFISIYYKKTAFEFEMTIILTIILLANSAENCTWTWNNDLYNLTTDIIFFGVLFFNYSGYLYSMFSIFAFACLCLIMILSGNRANPGSELNGLNEDKIKELEIIGYNELNDESQKVCSICLSEFDNNERIMLLPECKHVFHIDCIKEWFKRNHICPFCRNNVRRALKRKKRMEQQRNINYLM